MTAAELRIKLKSFRETLPVVRDRILVDAVQSSVASIISRVISSRLNQDLTIFGIYSPSYLKKRIKNNKGSDPRINFSYTNQMWKSTVPQLINSDSQEVRIRVQPLDSDRKKVMGYHDNRFGTILQPTDQEIDIIVDLFADGISDLIHDSF